jgi:hypothetical protein
MGMRRPWRVIQALTVCVVHEWGGYSVSSHTVVVNGRFHHESRSERVCLRCGEREVVE